MDFAESEKRALVFPLRKPESPLCNDILVLYNPGPTRVAFKIKTTNQERYIVRPNAEVIDADASIRIFIAVQPKLKLPPPGPSKDKFLVRIIPYLGEGPLPSNFWVTREHDPTVINMKFRVVFGNFYRSPSSPSSPPYSVGPKINHPSPATQPNPASPISVQPVSCAAPVLPSPSYNQSATATAPHARDLPPEFISGGSIASSTELEHSKGSAQNSPSPGSTFVPPEKDDELPAPSPLGLAQLSAETIHNSSLEERDSFVSRGTHENALKRNLDLQAALDEKTLEISRLTAEVAKLQTEISVLRNPLSTPTVIGAVDKRISDPFGSITGVSLMLIGCVLVVSIVFPLF